MTEQDSNQPPEPPPPPLVEHALKPEILMAIQRTAGNQAVARLLEERP